VELASIETYVLNTVCPQIINDKPQLLGAIGQARVKVRENAALLHVQGGSHQEDDHHFQANLAEISETIDNFLPYNIDSCELSIGNDTFLETLIMHIKNEVISYQRFLTKSKKKKNWP
jgi:hypothetical protein